MRFNELRGPALLVFESKLAYAIIIHTLENGQTTKIDGKEFTMIELSFMKKVMDMAISDLEEAWALFTELMPNISELKLIRSLLGGPPSGVIIATTLEVEFESASGTIMIVVPYSTIEPIKQKLSSSFQTDNDMAIQFGLRP